MFLFDFKLCVKRVILVFIFTQGDFTGFSLGRTVNFNLQLMEALISVKCLPIKGSRYVLLTCLTHGFIFVYIMLLCRLMNRFSRK